MGLGELGLGEMGGHLLNCLHRFYYKYNAQNVSIMQLRQMVAYYLG